MKSVCAVLLFLCTFSWVIGQKPLKPCGTKDHRSSWLQDYQKRNHKSDVRGGELIYVPLTLTIVTTNDNTGAIEPNILLGSLCTLNDDFKDANLHFYIEGDIRYISDSEFYNHDEVLTGAYKMLEYNIPNTINCYIMSNPAGNCGYNLPYAGIALGINCLYPDDHTWAHEMGHQLALPHPFLGWEGGHSHDGASITSFDEAAPEKVTYDYSLFQTEFYPDTLIIDTAYVEKVDGSNCSFAADGFCDTAPDYLALRWECNVNGESNYVQIDPNGESFRTSGANIMSYADDACSYEFSTEQIMAMRHHLNEEKESYLDNQTPAALISDATVEYLYPINSEVQAYDYIELAWEPIENATLYHVEIHMNEELTFRVWEDIVDEPNAIAEVRDIFADRDAYWTVTPFTKYEFCAERQGMASFYLSSVSSTNELLNNVRIYPTQLRSGNTIFIESDASLTGTYAILDITGKLMLENHIIDNRISTPSYLKAGVYMIQLRTEEGYYAQKIIVQ